MSRYSSKITQLVSGTQVAVPGAKIYVYSSQFANAQLEILTDDQGQPLSNPVVSDEYGDFYFNAPDGTKKIDVRFGGERKWREDVLVGPQPQGPPGINGGVGSSAGFAGLFGAANGMAIGAGITRIRTSGHSADGRGGADYIEDAAVNVLTVAANPRTQFLAADGRGFKLDPTQPLMAEMFGAVADYVSAGTPGTDNHAALTAACEFRGKANVAFSPLIQLGAGSYYISQTLEPRSVFHLRGAGGFLNSGVDGAQSNGTRLITPTDVATVRIHSAGTFGLSGYDPGNPAYKSASESVLENLSIEQATKGTNKDAHGVQLRGAAHLRDITVNNVAGDGRHIQAWTDGNGPGGLYHGNANDWSSRNFNVHNCGGYGSYIVGSDANTGYCEGFKVSTSGFAGLYVNTYYANTFVAPHFNLNYGYGGAWFGGMAYQNVNPTFAPTTQPGTNAAVWYPFQVQAAADAFFPLWVSGTVYKVLGPLVCLGRDTISDVYVEGNGNYGLCHAPEATVLGTNMGWTHLSCISGQHGTGSLTSLRGAGQFRSTGGSVTHPAYAAIGDGERTIVGAPDIDAANDISKPSMMRHHLLKGYHLIERWVSNDIHHGFYLQQPYYRWTGPLTTEEMGRGVAQPYYTVLGNYALRDMGSGSIRVHTLGNAAPTTGPHALGEIVWNREPVAGGFAGWICTAAGAPGTWKTFGAISA